MLGDRAFLSFFIQTFIILYQHNPVQVTMGFLDVYVNHLHRVWFYHLPTVCITNGHVSTIV